MSEISVGTDQQKCPWGNCKESNFEGSKFTQLCSKCHANQKTLAQAAVEETLQDSKSRSVKGSKRKQATQESKAKDEVMPMETDENEKEEDYPHDYHKWTADDKLEWNQNKVHESQNHQHKQPEEDKNPGKQYNSNGTRWAFKKNQIPGKCEICQKRYRSGWTIDEDMTDDECLEYYEYEDEQPHRRKLDRAKIRRKCCSERCINYHISDKWSERRPELVKAKFNKIIEKMEKELKDHTLTENEKQHEITEEYWNGWSIIKLGRKLMHTRLDREWPELEFTRTSISPIKWTSQIGKFDITAEMVQLHDKEPRVCIRPHDEKTPDEIQKHHSFAKELRRKMVNEKQSNKKVDHIFGLQESTSRSSWERQPPSESGLSIEEVELPRLRSIPEEGVTALAQELVLGSGNSKGAALEASPQSRRGTPSGAGAFDTVKTAEDPEEEVITPQDGHRKHSEGPCEIRRNNLRTGGSMPRDQSTWEGQPPSREERRDPKATKIDNETAKRVNDREYKQNDTVWYQSGWKTDDTENWKWQCGKVHGILEDDTYVIIANGKKRIAAGNLLRPSDEHNMILRSTNTPGLTSTDRYTEPKTDLTTSQTESENDTKCCMCDNMITQEEYTNQGMQPPNVKCPDCVRKQMQENMNTKDEMRCGICDNKTQNSELQNGEPLTNAKVCGECKFNHVMQYQHIVNKGEIEEWRVKRDKRLKRVKLEKEETEWLNTIDEIQEHWMQILRNAHFIWNSPGTGGCWPETTNYTWQGQISSEKQIAECAKADKQRKVELDNYNDYTRTKIARNMIELNQLETARNLDDELQSTKIMYTIHEDTARNNEVLSDYIKSMIGFCYAVATKNQHMAEDGHIELKSPKLDHTKLENYEHCVAIWKLFQQIFGVKHKPWEEASELNQVSDHCLRDTIETPTPNTEEAKDDLLTLLKREARKLDEQREKAEYESEHFRKFVEKGREDTKTLKQSLKLLMTANDEIKITGETCTPEQYQTMSKAQRKRYYKKTSKETNHSTTSYTISHNQIHKEKHNTNNGKANPQQCNECGKTTNSPLWTTQLVPQEVMNKRPYCSKACQKNHCKHKADGTKNIWGSTTPVDHIQTKCDNCLCILDKNHITMVRNSNSLRDMSWRRIHNQAFFDDPISRYCSTECVEKDLQKLDAIIMDNQAWAQLRIEVERDRAKRNSPTGNKILTNFERCCGGNSTICLKNSDNHIRQRTCTSGFENQRNDKFGKKKQNIICKLKKHQTEQK